MIRKSRQQRRLRPGHCRCGARLYSCSTKRRQRPDGRWEAVEVKTFYCGHFRSRLLSTLPAFRTQKQVMGGGVTHHVTV